MVTIKRPAEGDDPAGFTPSAIAPLLHLGPYPGLAGAEAIIFAPDEASAPEVTEEVFSALVAVALHGWSVATTGSPPSRLVPGPLAVEFDLGVRQRFEAECKKRPGVIARFARSYLSRFQPLDAYLVRLLVREARLRRSAERAGALSREPTATNTLPVPGHGYVDLEEVRLLYRGRATRGLGGLFEYVLLPVPDTRTGPAFESDAGRLLGLAPFVTRRLGEQAGRPSPPDPPGRP